MLINNNCKITGGAGAARSQCVREGATARWRKGRPAGLAGMPQSPPPGRGAAGQ